MMSRVVYSNNTGIWETPQAFFDSLDEEFHFDIDVCALPQNAKCKRFYTPFHGLVQPWKGVCWCNPPYGRGVEKWVRKAAESDATIVMLLPARTDTKWFHEYIYGKAEVRFIKGRLKFGSVKDNAPFPNMVVIFRNHFETKL